MNAIDVTGFNNLVKNRRTVKSNKFKQGSKVPDEVVTQALYNATWAPNHGKTEPWHFVVFNGDGLKKLDEFQSELYKQESGEKFNEGKYCNMQNTHKFVSHTIAICYKRQASTRIPETEEIQAIACAVQNFALTICAYGYVGYWSSGGITYYNSAKPFLNLSESDKLLGFYMIGESTEELTDGERKPLSEKVTWVNS